MNDQAKNSNAINRLTALWALSESGLGGIMHALKIPLTGIFVGGFAVVIIALLAYYSRRNFRIIIQATLLVILVKASVSPQSPFMAYIAVAFQGLAGGVIFTIVPYFKPAAIVFGFLALTESAIQKFLFTTILFGKSVWEALDIFFKSIAKDFHLTVDFSFSLWLIGMYTVIHALWGVFLGLWASTLPRQIGEKTNGIEKKYLLMKEKNTGEPELKKNKKSKILVRVSILVFTVLIFLAQGKMEQSIYIVLRTLAVILLLFFLMKPFTLWVLKRLRNKNREKTMEVIARLPELRKFVAPAFRMASESKKGPAKYFEFVLILIVLVLRDESEVS